MKSRFSLFVLLSFSVFSFACSSSTKEVVEGTANSAVDTMEEGTKAVMAEMREGTGVGTEVPDGATLLFDGSRESLHNNWRYWEEGPRFAAEMPIKWRVINDKWGTSLSTMDEAAAGGLYGAADIVTKEVYRDFRLHVEFLITQPKGNSGVYLQNRYEMQIVDGESTKHGMGAVINESESPYDLYKGIGEWNSYDIQFKAARFEDGEKTEHAKVTMYFNGQKAHTDFPITQVWGGPNSGVDGGNDKGKGITDTPQGLKLQAEGHDVRYRNVWIMAKDFGDGNTDF